MEIETLEIFQYLAANDPISHLEKELQKKLTLSTEIIYTKRNQIILTPGETNHWLYIIRSGAVERREDDGSIVAQFGEGDFFGQASLRREGLIKREVRAIEDTLLYRFPEELFLDLCKTQPYFQFYFNRNPSDQFDSNRANPNQSTNFNYKPVSELVHDTPMLVDHKVSVSDCANMMQKYGSTSLLITQNDVVKGIVTDRAFCTKVVAENLSNESPVGLIMSDELLTIDEQSTASEALLMMTRHNIRHLPVTSQKQVTGVLTATDLIHRQSNNPIYLVNQIFKANEIVKLVNYADQIPQTLCRLVENAHSAKDIGYSISSIGRAINKQLLKLAEEKFGPPPIKYTWIIAGSLARNDQTARSDQDNGIILDDSYNPELHQEYFEKLTKFVCDGLAQCGYIYCPGDVMATNKKWQQPLNVWKKYFEGWIVSPQPKALMYASIFFDLKGLYGDMTLLNELNEFVQEMIGQHKIFLNFMASNALQHTPPLGLFRGFVLEKHGTEAKALDMKKRGVVPITDLARVYALSCGCIPINTQERLKVAYEKQALSKSGYMDLTDAFEFLSFVRLSHQAKQINNQSQADNYLSPEELSSLERRHLKHTFEVISTYQSALSSRYQTGLMG